ncbi:MAG: hypothetical protein HUK14_06270 [Muribaculaceae bacterium]|nr:hypothetical protein [Muribaculaceae bacterium]
MKKNKKLKTIAIVAGIVVLWLIAATFFGPNSDWGISKTVEKLQADSVSLQADFRPHGRYTHFRDVDSAIDKIRNLADLHISDELDSARIFSNPRTAALANYNVAKCDSVLNDVLPLWRNAFVFALHNDFDKQVVIRFGTDENGKIDNTVLLIYCLKYLSEDEIKYDALKYNGAVANLGFTQVTYAASPYNTGYSYTFKKRQ